MEKCSNNFFLFYEKLVTNEGVLPIFFLLVETCVISSCCVVTYQNIASDTSTITRYENVLESTVG